MILKLSHKNWEQSTLQVFDNFLRFTCTHNYVCVLLCIVYGKNNNLLLYIFFQGALVPFSDEIIQHLQTEGRNMLAERLALCSGANVKMINGNYSKHPHYKNLEFKNLLG